MTGSDGVDRRTFLTAGATAGALALAGCAAVFGPDGTFDGGEIETVSEGFDHPWALEFVPDDGRLLVTEREGQLILVDRDDGTVEPVDGTPEVHAADQGGLLDAAVHPDFPDEPWLYLTYSATNDDGASATHLARGRLEPDEPRLADLEVLHVAEPFVDSDAHYGSRVGFGPDGLVYVTSGDRQFKNFGPEHVAQDPTNELGAVLRLEPDGSIPADNPFVEGEEPVPREDGEAVDDEDVAGAIYTYGHRNPQGLDVHPETDEIWVSEHGEEDGDEFNVLEAGGNYGWPVATYACEYGTDDPIGDDPGERDDLVPPVHYWECGSGGFPPAGMAFYEGDAFPDWQGDLFVGNLAGEHLGRFAVDGTDVEERDPLLEGQGWRVRDVAVAPDTGHLYVAIDDGDAPVVRLVPD